MATRTATTSGFGRLRSLTVPPAKRVQRLFLKNYAEFLPRLDSPPAESWSQMAPMALWTYALGNGKGRSQAVDAIRRADPCGGSRSGDAPVPIPTYQHEDKRLLWGSNGVAAEYGMYLLIADQFAPDPELCRYGARQSALPAGTQHILAFVGHPAGRQSVPASASPAQRGCKQQAPGPGFCPAGRTPAERCGIASVPKDCRRQRFMPIRWPLMQAMK